MKWVLGSAGTVLLFGLVLVACSGAENLCDSSPLTPDCVAQLTASVMVDGAPANGISVSISGLSSATSTTDAAGAATFTDLAAGAYAVSVDDPGVSWDATQVMVTLGVSATRTVSFTGTALIPPEAYGAGVLADNPVAYFKLDDPGSTQTDEVGGFDLTSVGSPTPGVPGIVTGTEDLAVAFFDDRLSHSDPMSNGSGSLTIELWYRPEAGSVSADEVNIVNLFGTDAGGPADNLVVGTVDSGDSIGAAGSVRLRGYIFDQGVGGLAYVNGPALSVGAVYHLVLRFDDTTGTLEFFVDGTSVDQQTTSIAVDWNDQTLHVGGAPHLTTRNAVGTIDEVAIYRAALPSSRIAAHFTTGRSP